MNAKKSKLKRLIKSFKETPDLVAAKLMKLKLHCKENVNDLEALYRLNYITITYLEYKNDTL